MKPSCSSRSPLHERLAKAISDVERATLANIDAALPVFKEALSALSETFEPPQDWKDIFVEYEAEGRTDAWLYQQIEAHSRRADRSASVPNFPCKTCGAGRLVDCNLKGHCPHAHLSHVDAPTGFTTRTGESGDPVVNAIGSVSFICTGCGEKYATPPIEHTCKAPPSSTAASGDPFNCPDCGAHDYGLFAGAMVGCPHCLRRDNEELRRSHDSMEAKWKAALSATGETFFKAPFPLPKEVGAVLAEYDLILARADLSDPEWDFVMRAADWREIREFFAKLRRVGPPIEIVNPPRPA